jgi:hypothetical protein
MRPRISVLILMCFNFLTEGNKGNGGSADELKRMPEQLHFFVVSVAFCLSRNDAVEKHFNHRWTQMNPD